ARDAHAEAADVAGDELPTATDGCGVVTFALPLERMAYAYARYPQLPDADRVVDAMQRHPDLVGGPDGADAHLMQQAPGWFANGGALALKAEDGAARLLGPALAHVVGRLGVDLPALHVVALTNSRGEHVGELRLARSS